MIKFPSYIEKYRVDPNDFIDTKPKKIIISGYGIVTFKIQQSTQLKVVVKRTKDPLADNPLFLRSFKREVELLVKAQHPAIVPFVGFSQDEYYGYIYLYHIENGSLSDFLKNASNRIREKDFDEHNKFIIAYGVASVMEYLHSNNWIHRDLKADNILIDSEYHPYVTDFGTAKEVDPNIPINQTLADTTIYIMAPEFMEDAPFFSNSPGLDVYAYGMTLYELWTEMRPFNDIKNPYRIYQEVMNGTRPKIPSSLPKNWKKLIEDCWNQNPRSRPTFEQIVHQLESSEFLTDEKYIQKLKEYKEYLKDQQSKAKKKSSQKNICRISSFRISPVLAKMREEAQSGDTTAMYNYVISQFEGKYGEPDFNEIIKFATKYANRPNSTDKKNANDTATILYYSGMSFLALEKYEEAKNMFRRSSDNGNGDAAYELAKLIADEKNEEIDADVQLYLKRAAEFGNPKGIKNYAYMLYYGMSKKKTKSDKEDAIKYFQKGSDNGDPELMYMWAIRNEYGRDIPKNTKEAMRLMKLSAEIGYGPAMVNYGLHLLNGFNVPKDQKRATELFKEAALVKNDPEALLWYSVMLIRNPEIDDENEPQILLKRCINTQEVPEAWGIYGRLLAKEDKISEAIPNLQQAIQNGSLDAFLCLGELCEKDPSLGNSKYYYELASNYCHCLDTHGFFTPIEYKIYHCSNCNIDICEGCAKHCHSGHKIKEIGKQSGFKCGCGQHGFEGKCSGEFIGETECYQHLYQCSTCCMNSDHEYICKNCAEICHKGHEITDCGVQRSFCSCGMKNLPHKFLCRILQYNEPMHSSSSCTNTNGRKKIKQRWFQCITCGLDGSDEIGICQGCASICHDDHIIIDLGVKEQCCCCRKKNCSFT